MPATDERGNDFLRDQLIALRRPAAVRVTDADDRVFSAAVGASTSTLFYAASVAKQFTAALAAMAVLEGVVREETSVRAVLPELPRWAAPIRLRHLVHHTSGLPTTAEVLDVVGGTEALLDNDRVLAGLRGAAAPAAPAGGRFQYSNLGYVVLAEMLARTMGDAVPRLAATRLFRPLRLFDARWTSSVDETALTSDPVSPPRSIGDGGLWISTENLHAWLRGLNRRELGGDLSCLVETADHLSDGTGVPYAWGAMRRPHARGPRYTHGGDWPGWTAKTLRQPSTGVVVALMTRGAEAVGVTAAVDRIAEQLASAR